MAKSAARLMLVKKGSTTIAAVRQKRLTINSQPIDVTNDDDAGIETYLSNAFATESMSIDVEGFSDDHILFDLAASTNPADRHLSDLTLTHPNGDVISGTFIMTSFNIGGASADALDFSATLIRSGIHTLTAA